MDEKKDVSFEILQHLGTLYEGSKKVKELNIVKWGDNDPKFDLRTWEKDHSKAGRGITLSAGELQKLKEILDGMS